MSALPLKADMRELPRNVRFVPKADFTHRSKKRPIRSPRRRARAVDCLVEPPKLADDAHAAVPIRPRLEPRIEVQLPDVRIEPPASRIDIYVNRLEGDEGRTSAVAGDGHRGIRPGETVECGVAIVEHERERIRYG